MWLSSRNYSQSSLWLRLCPVRGKQNGVRHFQAVPGRSLTSFSSPLSDDMQVNNHTSPRDGAFLSTRQWWGPNEQSCHTSPSLLAKLLPERDQQPCGFSTSILYHRLTRSASLKPTVSPEAPKPACSLFSTTSPWYFCNGLLTSLNAFPRCSILYREHRMASLMA